MRIRLLAVALLVTGLSCSAARAEIEPNTLVEIDKDEAGHFYSQIIYAPAIDAFVSWGTRTHSAKVRGHETQFFRPADGKWVDAWPYAPTSQPDGAAGEPKLVDWAGQYKSWPGWNIADIAGSFYERGGVKMPQPTSSFYQCAWDGHNKRIVFYVASMTFSYDPVKRDWTLIHDKSEKAQPPALLLWGSLCYDPENKRMILFGGGGVDAPDGRPHTWALDVTTDKWSKLDLDVEPPARCNSRMVYDSRNKLIVLFGGDAQDSGLADTWVFDVTKSQWQQRKPAASPSPRCCHGMAFLEKSGVVLLLGGHAIGGEWQKRKGLSEQVWAYDAAKDVWTPVSDKGVSTPWLSMESIPGTDEVIVATGSGGNHARTTYRFRYDGSAKPAAIEGVPPGTVNPRAHDAQWYTQDVPEATPKEHLAEIAAMPNNTWIEVKPPKTVNGRTWGTSLFDSKRGVAMKWGGGHSGYQGTDMAFYDVAANRWTIDRRPAFTPDPFGAWAQRPGGRTFFNQPWARHMRHTCAYDAVRDVGVFTDAGGSDWYERDAGKTVKHTWTYDPARRAWNERLLVQPFPGGSAVSPIAVPTPSGVVVYHRGELWRFVGEAGKVDTFGWTPIKIETADRPRQHEHMTIVYDSKRDRLIFLTADKQGQPELWFFSMSDRKWVANPKPAEGGVTTREAVYVPDQDAIVAYGPAGKDDDKWTRVYLCGENRWVTPAIETPHSQSVHEIAMEYDPVHKLVVLLWPPAFESGIRPHLFKLDAGKLK